MLYVLFMWAVSPSNDHIFSCAVHVNVLSSEDITVTWVFPRESFMLKWYSYYMYYSLLVVTCYLNTINTFWRLIKWQWLLIEIHHNLWTYFFDKLYRWPRYYIWYKKELTHCFQISQSTGYLFRQNKPVILLTSNVFVLFYAFPNK